MGGGGRGARKLKRGNMAHLTKQFSFNPPGVFFLFGTSVATNAVYLVDKDDL